jgi:hypothetical protein
MGIATDLKWVQLRLSVITYIVYGIMSVFMSYYLLTRKFVFTFFGSPATYGMLTSERFASLEWWATLSWTAAWFPVLWVGSFLLLHWRSKGYKITFIVYLAVTMVVWLCIFVLHLVWITGRNNPLTPDNPANSYRACCAPEFYNTVPKCENYGSASPECNPPINLSELGSNGDFVVAFAMNISFIVLWAFYLFFTVEFMKLMDKYNANGGDAMYLTQKKTDSTDMQQQSLPSQQPQQPVLLNVETTKQLIAVRAAGGARPFSKQP